MPKQPKKKQGKLIFHHAPHLDQDMARTHYTLFSADTAGGFSRKTSTLRTRPSSNTQQPPDDASPLSLDDALPFQADPLNWNEDCDQSPQQDPLFDAAYVQHLEDTCADETVKRVRAKGDETLREFVPQIDLFLEELIGLESRGRWPSEACADCGVGGMGIYQCVECLGRKMLCVDCIVQAHSNLHFHRIQKWNQVYFEKTSLKALGLRMQLGHAVGEQCAHPVQCSNDDFIVLHSNGMHEVGVNFCGCGSDNQLHIVQLLRARLFPATVTHPKTAATLDLLDLFSILSYESKMSAFQFYHSLSRLTDNTGMYTPKDHYPSFLRMIHKWRHLMMLKRAGRGHDPQGVAATKEGECAILCPACPQPGKNMPPNWKQRPADKQFLDTLFVSLDANFRLKRKNVSSHDSDPGLSQGFSFFVEETKYRKHLHDYTSEVEPKCSCSRHDAVHLSETKPGQGHASTGVGAVVCSRHDMKWPNAVAQLQKGERYCNMDYIFYSTLKDTEVETFVISYDIVCQWSIHLRMRMAAYSPNFFMFDNQRQITFLVPKFHLPAHVAKCRTQFSFNLTKNVGRTEGESPERGWVGPNALAPSTKEMGPGACRDTLDVHFGDANHKKIIGLGDSLLQKIRAAASEMAEHVIGHRELEGTIPQASLSEWTAAVEMWEADSSQPNPFEMESSGPTQAAVRRQLAEDERKLLEAGKDFTLDDRVTPSVLIAMGIDLENEQRSYKDATSRLWEHSLDRQHTKLILRGNTLIRKIEAWAKYQTLYLPAVSRLRNQSLQNVAHGIELKAHDLSLWLPSQIRSQIAIPEPYRRLEFDLRIPQANEALDNLRLQLQVRAHVFKFKDRNVRGQGANTRARNVLEGIQNRIDLAANEYRAAYHALCCLGPMLHETQWAVDFMLLKNEDIRDLSEGKSKQSEGKRDISWIWRTVSVDRIDMPQEDHFRQGVRIEWAKSRARANRFTEEVALLKEEMVRVLRFFTWKAENWESKADITTWKPELMSQMRTEGFVAYAKRQADMYRSLISHFRLLWTDVPAHVAKMQALISE